MKEGWKYESFGNVFPIRMGKTPPRADKEMWDANKKTKNLWVSVADITSNEGQDIISTKEHISELAAQRMRIVPKGYLLMSFKLTIGKMAFAGKDLFTNEAIIAIPKNDKYNLRFLYYYLSSYNWDTLTTGAEKVKGKTLNKSSIGKIQLPIIPLPEQERIVSLLDAEFAKIDAIKANAEKQLQDAKALFQSALKDYLTPKEGWEEKNINSISENLDFKRIPITKNKRTEGIYPYYGASGIVDYVDDYIFDDTLLLISEDGANLVARVTPIAFSVQGKCWVNNHAHVLKFDNDNLQRFVEYYFATLNISDLITGAAQPKLTQGALNKIKISFPKDESELKIIIFNLDSFSAKIQSLQSNFDTTVTLCNDLKQSILKDIFG